MNNGAPIRRGYDIITRHKRSTDIRKSKRKNIEWFRKQNSPLRRQNQRIFSDRTIFQRCEVFNQVEVTQLVGHVLHFDCHWNMFKIAEENSWLNRRTSERKKKKIWNVPQSQKLPTFRFPHAVGWCEAQTKPSQIQNARRRRWLDPIFFFFHFNSRFLCCSWMIRICVYALWTIRIQGLYTNGVNIFFAFLPSISHSLESGPLLLLSENCVFVVPVSVCVSAGVVAVLCTSAYSMPSGKKLHIYYHLMRQFWRAAKLSSFSIYIYLKLQFWAPCSAVQCAP